MTGFDDLYSELVGLVAKFERAGLPLKVERDSEGDIVRIFGPGAGPLLRARAGLRDAAELAYTAAEHHPYWNLLYHSAEIASSALERWEGTLSEEDLKEISWSIEKLRQTLEKTRD